jgi:hypothetical protein
MIVLSTIHRLKGEYPAADAHARARLAQPVASPPAAPPPFAATDVVR